MKIGKIYNVIRQFSNGNITPRVCIIGAGPAGFYAAQQLLKTSSNVTIDILEKLPVPFGLVRFGVAPDHPEVKNVINTFQKTATNPRVQFIGNVNVGKDISINELREFYHAILLTYGAEEDRTLDIPGERLNNVISGRRFVGWYNGVPADKNLEINLDLEEAVILGQGNVAIDIARILLSPIDKLKKTDITSYALEKLSHSKVRKVSLIGRRGPLQAAFTIAELREMLKLEGCKTHWRVTDFAGIKEAVPNLARPRKRLTELMLKSLDEMSLNNESMEKEFHPIFFRSPVEFVGHDTVEAVKCSINKIDETEKGVQKAVPTGKFEDIPCNLAFRSIGYKSIQIDESIPFDSKVGRVIGNQGKIGEKFYAAGWVATGPVGVILTTMTNAFQVGGMLAKDLNVTESKSHFEGLKKILDKKNVQTVSYMDWNKIDQVEQERGKSLGKPREKIVDINEMLNIAGK